MAKKPPPEGHLDKIEAKEEGSGEASMERFKSLTRRLLNISNVELQRELEQYKKKKGSK